MCLYISSSLRSASAQIADFDRASTVRLATTTSTENSGLLNELLPRFKAATGYEVHVIAVGTGKALRMGRDGDVDVGAGACARGGAAVRR